MVTALGIALTLGLTLHWLLRATEDMVSRDASARALRELPEPGTCRVDRSTRSDNRVAAVPDGVVAPSSLSPATSISASTPTTGRQAQVLVAVVIWCGPQHRAVLPGGGGLLDWPRRKRQELWLALGPLGGSATVAGRPLFGGRADDVFSAVGTSTTFGSEPVAHYDGGAHTIRVLGRVLVGPRPGRTLVILVDAAGERSAAPAFTAREVQAPPEVRTGFVQQGFGTISVMLSAEPLPAELLPALRADPVIFAFMQRVGME